MPVDVDSDSGYIGHISQISNYEFGEWDTYRWSDPYLPTYYPSKTQTSSTVMREADTKASTPAGEASTEGAERPRSLDIYGIGVMLTRDGAETDAIVVKRSDIDVVSAENLARTESLFAQPGPYRAILTFSRRLSVAEFALLTSSEGITVSSFEANGEGPDGLTASLGGPVDELAIVEGQFADEGVHEFGIVAADVMLASATAYDRLVASPLVRIVDLSAEVVARALRDEGPIDVVINDLFWAHAHLTQ